MRKGTIILLLAIAAIVVFVFATHSIMAQEGPGPGPRGERFRRGRPREHMRPGFIEAEEWIEDAKKVRDEIIAINEKLDPLREDLHKLWRKARSAATKEEREKLRAEAKAVSKKVNVLELEAAAKNKDFAVRNYERALKRMIEAEVEYRLIEHKIRLRKRMFEKGPRGPGRGPRRRDSEGE